MSKSEAKIGWIGVGRMGYQMVERLLKANYDVSIWNRTKSKAEPLVQLGGKIVMPPYRTLAEALGNRFVQPNAFVEDVRVEHRFNRLLVYKANLIHSATAYWGLETATKRMTAVFFWMA